MSEQDDAQKPSYRAISGINESLEAIAQVVASAERTLRVFDVSLSNRGFNSPAIAEKLRQFFLAGRAHRLLIALHNTELLERESPRLLLLLALPLLIASGRCAMRTYETPREFVPAVRSIVACYMVAVVLFTGGIVSHALLQ